MHIIVATEIWGRTPHVDAMVAGLEDIASKITVVDPYDGADPAFASQDEAHARYKADCGHEQYAQRVSEAVLASTEPVCLLGFSAGATAVWTAVCADSVGQAKGALCFYSSSMYEMTDFVPKIPVDMVFATSEPNYDVETVGRDIQDIPLAQSYITPFEHGFLNPACEDYSEDVYFFWLQWIKDQLAIHYKA